MHRLVAIVLATAILAFGPVANSQGQERTHESDAQALSYRIAPMMQEEVQGEVDLWIAALKDKVTRISAARQAGDNQLAATLELERTALIERVDAVLANLEAKGGDVTTSRAYVDAVSGIAVDLTDASAVMTKIKTWSTSPEGGLKWLQRIVMFILIIIGFRIVSGLVAKVVRRAIEKFGHTGDLLRDFLVGMVSKLIRVVGLVVALAAIGVPMGPFLAAIGAAGLVIGLALQGTLSNFASGIMILLYRPFDVGHFVNAGGAAGTVKAMNLVSTTLTTPDNQTIVVPNNAVWGGTITNVTGNDTRRVDMVFGIGYGDDIEKTRGVLEEIVNGHALTFDDPAPTIQVSELADSSVNFVCRPWCKTSDYWAVFFDIHTEVKKRFDAEGISIPFPQQDVHMHQAG